MYLTTDLVAPQELTGYARASLDDLPDNQGSLEQFLPNNNVDDLVYRFTKGGEGLVEAATFRSYDTESGIASRPGVTRVTGELPPISRKIRLGEYDRLRLRNATDAIVDNVFRDAEKMVAAIAARVELARGEALYDGKLTLDENGIIGTVDFGRIASHSTSASVLWSNASTATPIADLQAWAALYEATNDGQLAGAIVMSRKAYTAALRTNEVRSLGNISGAVAGVVSPAQFNQILEAFGLPPIVLYNRSVRVNGSARRVIPEKAVILVPAPDDPSQPLGGTLWGTTAESLEPRYNLSGDEPGIVAGAYKTDDPVAVWTKAAAISLPMLANPNLSLRADVLA